MTISTQTAISSDTDILILVDAHDNEIGTLDKAACHRDHGVLHRAFSIFIFNGKNELLIQQRSQHKRLWPGYWSNSCCSHPRQGETIEVAVQRRAQEELGITAPLHFMYKFQYQAQYDATGAEHELCSVFVAKTDQKIQAQSEEIADWRFIDLPTLQMEMQQRPELFTPWFKQEIAELRQTYHAQLSTLDIQIIF